MASQVPPLRAAAFTYEISLVSQGDTDIFQVNPTLAAGDIVVYQDGALDGNADNIPTVVGAGKIITHTLSIAEMTADRVTVIYSDAVGDEWQDLIVNIHTVTTSQIDDLATAAALAALNDLSAAGVWTYATRTLTTSVASALAVVSGATIAVLRGDTWSISIAGMGDISARTKLWFTVKISSRDVDDESIIMIEETAGLIRLNGAAAGVAGNGSITVTDAVAGDITIALDEVETAKVVPATLVYDVQMFDGTDITTLTTGSLVNTADINRATS